MKGPFWAAGRDGDDAYKYFLYEPASPAPAQAPVVLFIHGWTAYDPNEYIAWMTHIVRKGHTVVWAQYDKSVFITLNWTGNAVETWRDALRRLGDTREAHVRPERNSSGKILNAVVGHSFGAYMAPVFAVKATRPWNGIPEVDAVILFMSAGKGVIPGDDYSKIPPSTKMLYLTAEGDGVACTGPSIEVWNAASQIPLANREFLFLQADSHGNPALTADHFFPNSTGKGTNALVDARDYFVTFRFTVAAMNCAFRGTDCQIGFGKGAPEQITMGMWSDGVLVKPLISTTEPEQLPLSARCRAMNQ